MEYNQGETRRVISKSAECPERGQFEVKSMITPELYNTKFYILTINHNYNEIQEEYDSSINYLTS